MKRASLAVLLGAGIFAAAGCASFQRASLGGARLHHLGPKAKAQANRGFLPVRHHDHSSAPCVGSCLWDRQGRLDSLAGYATRVAGAAHVFAGVRIDDPANRVILFLVHAPQSVIARIRKGHGDTYVIHNDAPRTLHAVMALQNSFDWAAWKAKGVHVVSIGPTQTGYLQVGVNSNVAKAQALFDAAYPSGVIRVVHDEPGMPTSLTGPTG